MPILSSVRRTGKCDCSTSRMISSFSQAGYLMRRLPHPRSCFFFEHTALEGQLGHDLLQRVGLATQILDLVRSGGPGRIARQPLLARLEEVLRPAVIQVLDDSLA